MSDEAHILAGITRRPGAVVLRLADGQTLEVAPEAVPPGLPGVGGRLDAPLLAALREAAARKQVARRLLAMLARRLDSRERLLAKLCAQGFAPATVAAVLAEAEVQGLCSDRLFAAAYCRDTLRERAVGRLWLKARLCEKGVTAALADAVSAEQLPPASERELAARAAAARWVRERTRDWRALARVQRFLVSRGFAPAMAGEAARAARPIDRTQDEAAD